MLGENAKYLNKIWKEETKLSSYIINCDFCFIMVLQFPNLPGRADKAQKTNFHIPVKMKMSYITPLLLGQCLI